MNRHPQLPLFQPGLFGPIAEPGYQIVHVRAHSRTLRTGQRVDVEAYTMVRRRRRPRRRPASVK